MVEILVLPPWWMARAMVVAYGVLALLAVAGGGLWLRRRIGRAHREQIASITRKNKLDLLEAKVSLFTEVANEIRTPVALIAAPVEEIAKRAGNLPGLRDDVDIIRKNCERLRTLVDQILNLKSAEEGEHAASCVPERVDVGSIADGGRGGGGCRPAAGYRGAPRAARRSRYGRDVLRPLFEDRGPDTR